MKINIITLGCSKNIVDSEHIAGHLRKAGFKLYFDRTRNDCDIVIVNTCGFIGDAKESDVVIIDTAGRLHNKVGLMNELTKIRRVMQKLVPDAPHEVLLVLDASTGQNAVEQARQFTQATDVNALALTKLDGTAKGGVIIGISDQFQVPVRYIGLGEKMTDLQLFDPDAFVDSLFE